MTANETDKDILPVRNISVPQEMFLNATNELVDESSPVVGKEYFVNKESVKHFPCKKQFKTEGLWRNLSRRHWPELLDIYGVNVMDR